MTTPGLTALTRILRSFRSVAQPRARFRTAALAAEYTLNAGMPIDAAVDAFRTIELALGNSGSAFCTVSITPLTLWYCCSLKVRRRTGPNKSADHDFIIPYGE